MFLLSGMVVVNRWFSRIMCDLFWNVFLYWVVFIVSFNGEELLMLIVGFCWISLKIIYDKYYYCIVSLFLMIVVSEISILVIKFYVYFIFLVIKIVLYSMFWLYFWFVLKEIINCIKFYNNM